jgi:uncharacterized protein with ParB-like and HNH nuclease domain
MYAVAVALSKLLSASKTQFTIPIYQRTYNWPLEQCKQLWEDIIRTGTNPSIPAHFIGSIVYITNQAPKSAIQPLMVIDGQQRLTTISLLLLALANVLDKTPGTFKTSGRKIRNYYLLNSEEDDEQRYKLILTQSDRETLKCIVDGKELPENPSTRIIENYQFFEKQIRESIVDLNCLYDGIEKLFIVDVSLDRDHDNPQLIFESLNSTGLELSQADLIRNFILMGLEYHEQKHLYEDYWYRMEQSFSHVEYSSYFDRFIRDYLTIKSDGRIPNIDKVYMEFKAYVRNNFKLTMRDIVAEIYKYSKYFVGLSLKRKKMRRFALASMKSIR